MAAGASAISLINTINSITGVDLDTLEISPNIGGKGGHGGYAGPAVKPVALNMLSALGADDLGGVKSHRWEVLLFGDCGAFSYAFEEKPPFSPEQAARLY